MTNLMWFLFKKSSIKILGALVLVLMASLAYGGNWTELSGTQLKNSPIVQDYGSKKVGPLGAIISAWGGGVFDTKRNQFVIWGGGHTDSARNELYAFNFNSKKWLRLTDGGPPPMDKKGRIWPKNKCMDEMPIGKGNPVSRHTYGNLAYIAHADRLFAFGGSQACGSGGFGNDTWTFNFSDLTWKKMKPSGPRPGRTIAISQYDEETRLVWVRTKNGLFSYDYDDNKWSKFGGGKIPSLDKSSGAIHPVLRQFVIVGPGGVFAIPLDDSGKSPSKLETTGKNINPKIIAKRSPGFDYDPKRNRLVLWGASDVDKSPGTVYFLDLEKKEWTSDKPASGPQKKGGRGTFGRWRYIPKLDAFAAVKSVNENVFVYSHDPNPSLEALSQSGQSTPPKPSDSLVEEKSQQASTSEEGKNSNAVVSASETVRLASNNSSGGQRKALDIPLRTWIARKPAPHSAYYSSKGKHGRVVFNPDDGKMYLFSGDGGGERGLSNNGRQEMATYDIATDTWENIQRYCRKDHGIQPMGPDEVGFAYDTKRRVFWHNPGFGHHHKCKGGKLLRHKVLSFDPVTRTWKDENRTTLKKAFGEITGNHRFVIYDPVQDALIGLRKNRAYVYHIADDRWEKHKINSEIAGDEYLAFDPEQRYIYVIENLRKRRLYRYNIDDEDLEDLGPVPKSAKRYKESHALWDSVNKVVLWPLWTTTEDPMNDTEILMLYVYHPDTEKWEEIPIVQPTSCPEGLNCTVRGRHSAYDPINNVLLVMKPKGPGTIPGPAPVFLFRYGGKGKTPLPPTKPFHRDTTAPSPNREEDKPDPSPTQKAIQQEVRPSSPTNLIISPVK